MVQAAWAGIGDADAVLLLLDAKQGLRDTTRRLMERQSPPPLRGREGWGVVPDARHQ